MPRRLWETGASTDSPQALLAWHSALSLGRCPRLPSANPASLKQTPTLASLNLSLHSLFSSCVVLYSVLFFCLLLFTSVLFFFLFVVFVSYFCFLSCSVLSCLVLLCRAVLWPLSFCPSMDRTVKQSTIKMSPNYFSSKMDTWFQLLMSGFAALYVILEYFGALDWTKQVIWRPHLYLFTLFSDL